MQLLYDLSTETKAPVSIWWGEITVVSNAVSARAAE